MRIKEEFKKRGYFWLPSVPDKKIPGTLSISDGGKIELEVIGRFDERFDADEIPRIIGHIEKHGIVTLDKCLYTHRNFSFSGGAIYKSLLHVHWAFVGLAFDENESVTFDTFKFSVEGIDQWIGISGIKVSEPNKDHISIEFSPPEDITIDLDNDMKLLIIFSWTYPGYPHLTEATVTQKAYFKLVSTEPRSLYDYVSIAHQIATFLCFAIDRTVCIEHVSATNADGVGNSPPLPIFVYYQSLPYVVKESKIEMHNMLFRYELLQNNFETIINNWISAHDEIKPAISLYFSAKLGSHKYLDSKFLSLVQGLETYHRRTSDETLMDEAIFNSLITTIIESCPEENREWLSGKLEYGNEISLGTRIKRVMEPFKQHFGNSRERSRLIRNIVDTRNYLTHFDESLDGRAASGAEMVALCFKMEALFQMHLLRVVGFTHSEIQSILSKNYQVQQKLSYL